MVQRPVILLPLAILLPSIVLGWLAVRSLQTQQAASGLRELQLQQERARRVAAFFSEAVEQQREAFNHAVNTVLRQPGTAAPGDAFGTALRMEWPAARIGFIVSSDKRLVAPSVRSGEAARAFRLENEKFLTNREPLEVYRFSRKAFAAGGGISPSTQLEKKLPFRPGEPEPGETSNQPAQFEQLIGNAADGAYSRFLADELQLFFWTRDARYPDLIFGAQVDMGWLRSQWALPFQGGDEGVCLAILDEKNSPVCQTVPGFQLAGRAVFAEAPVGVLLPYWRAAVYLTDPDRIARTARSTRWLVAGTVVLLVTAVAVGTFLIILGVNREVALARQQTDFVSNVSHELKTPLTSIRMFAELLESDAGRDPVKSARYLEVIRTETARLTRMINNVLDFTRHGQKSVGDPARDRLDLRDVVMETLETLRPQLEADGFRLGLAAPEQPVEIIGDREALAQILSNLLSNAEKYSGDIREIEIRVTTDASVQVEDRGIGIARGEEEAVFRNFYRASNAASTGAGGAGLGLTIARRLAESLNGTLTHRPREGGGTVFTLKLPPAPLLPS